MIAKLEQFVRHLAEDQAFREIAAQEPEKAVAMFGLIGPERQGALALCAQGGGASATTTAESFWW